MENIILFFQELSDVEKLVFIVAFMSVFWYLEGAFPLVHHQYQKWKHARVNLILATTSLLINFGFGFIIAAVIVWTESNTFGLLYMLELPLWVEALLGLILLDLIAQYTIHYLLHKVKFMWKFHMVHHSDTKVDVTTGTRHHPGDYLFREVFSLIAMVVGGIPFGVYMLYRIMAVLMTYWTHSNLSLPASVDRILSFVFITPHMHKFHHHFERPWTDSNYGNIFSVWDRVFGTFVYDNPRKIEYGLDVLEDKHADNLIYQLKVPFDNSIETD